MVASKKYCYYFFVEGIFSSRILYQNMSQNTLGGKGSYYINDMRNYNILGIRMHILIAQLLVGLAIC